MSEAPARRPGATGTAQRGKRGTTAEESWFGAFSGADDTQLRDDGASSAFDSRHQARWSGAADGFENSRLLAREARRGAESDQPAFDRIYGNFLSARAALGAALAVTLLVAIPFGLRPQPWSLAVGMSYALLAAAMWLVPRVRGKQTPRTQLRGRDWIATIGVDLSCFILLHVLAAGAGLNYVALMVLPLLMAGVLTPRTAALATAATASIALLAVAWLAVAQGGDAMVVMTQAGLAGIGLFVVTIVAGELAGRLAREELSARGSMEMARQQAQLNQLVIEEMQDGVLVVDRRGKVRAANPAARRLLVARGSSAAAPFPLRGNAAWADLERAVERAFADATWPAAGRDVTLRFDDGSQRTVRARVRFTRKREPKGGEEFCVLFVEDLKSMEARTRQEKLAAMGRVSAGIAHEIRNPLAAIAQANALLSEDATDPAQRRLMGMVTDNVERLKRIVDDVMAVAPGAPQDSITIDASAQVAAICAEWARGHGVTLGGDGLLNLAVPGAPLGAAFDPEHLRRVLVNLLDNAQRHATSAPGAVRVRLEVGPTGHVVLGVASTGEPIPADVERHLFEPFFSTRSRGTGLGLYICRELCERHGASIDFELRPAGQGPRNEFVVAMQRRPLQASAETVGDPTP